MTVLLEQGQQMVIVPVVKRGTAAFRTEYLPGSLAALACAFTWSGYSVLNRRFGETPTDVMAGFCGAVAVRPVMASLLPSTQNRLDALNCWSIAR
jgi:drug/metabolite transporter (DMT)-like permease